MPGKGLYEKIILIKEEKLEQAEAKRNLQSQLKHTQI